MGAHIENSFPIVQLPVAIGKASLGHPSLNIKKNYLSYFEPNNRVKIRCYWQTTEDKNYKTKNWSSSFVFYNIISFLHIILVSFSSNNHNYVCKLHVIQSTIHQYIISKQLKYNEIIDFQQFKNNVCLIFAP